MYSRKAAKKGRQSWQEWEIWQITFLYIHIINTARRETFAQILPMNMNIRNSTFNANYRDICFARKLNSNTKQDEVLFNRVLGISLLCLQYVSCYRFIWFIVWISLSRMFSLQDKPLPMQSPAENVLPGHLK